MKRSETIIEKEDYVKAKKPLVYMQVLDLILAASRSCLLYSEVVAFAKVLSPCTRGGAITYIEVLIFQQAYTHLIYRYHIQIL